ncbi:unnamed protein product [Phytophthora fragariaefolia]|uniref:Unnamed protein product n=1 Tax=Phytophthora fragariaefolia TaxID=1490495 RepID=A0A9W6U6U9_9STRA|nr:unnamed protein product [Phytophthora fragariaefolia]
MEAGSTEREPTESLTDAAVAKVVDAVMWKAPLYGWTSQAANQDGAVALPATKQLICGKHFNSSPVSGMPPLPPAVSRRAKRQAVSVRAQCTAPEMDPPSHYRTQQNVKAGAALTQSRCTPVAACSYLGHRAAVWCTDEREKRLHATQSDPVYPRRSRHHALVFSGNLQQCLQLDLETQCQPVHCALLYSMKLRWRQVPTLAFTGNAATTSPVERDTP